jgi:hypothetical protein
MELPMLKVILFGLVLGIALDEGLHVYGEALARMANYAMEKAGYFHISGMFIDSRPPPEVQLAVGDAL